MHGRKSPFSLFIIGSCFHIPTLFLPIEDKSDGDAKHFILPAPHFPIASVGSRNSPLEEDRGRKEGISRPNLFCPSIRRTEDEEKGEGEEVSEYPLGE